MSATSRGSESPGVEVRFDFFDDDFYVDPVTGAGTDLVDTNPGRVQFSPVPSSVASAAVPPKMNAEVLRSLDAVPPSAMIAETLSDLDEVDHLHSAVPAAAADTAFTDSPSRFVEDSSSSGGSRPRSLGMGFTLAHQPRAEGQGGGGGHHKRPSTVLDHMRLEKGCVSVSLTPRTCASAFLR